MHYAVWKDSTAILVTEFDISAYKQQLDLLIKLLAGEPVVPGEHHEGGGDQAEGPVLPLHSATAGQ